jgi:hypothetical protein
MDPTVVEMDVGMLSFRLVIVAVSFVHSHLHVHMRTTSVFLGDFSPASRFTCATRDPGSDMRSCGYNLSLNSGKGVWQEWPMARLLLLHPLCQLVLLTSSHC